MLKNKCDECYVQNICKFSTSGCCKKNITKHCNYYIDKVEHEKFESSILINPDFYKTKIEFSEHEKLYNELGNKIIEYFYPFGTWKGHAIIKELFNIIHPIKIKLRGDK